MTPRLEPLEPRLTPGRVAVALSLALAGPQEHAGPAGYERYLRREPTPAERVLAAAAAPHTTDLQWEVSFLASDEYFALAGGRVRPWVEALYRDAVGRAGEPDGVDYWVVTTTGGNVLANDPSLDRAQGGTQSEPAVTLTGRGPLVVSNNSRLFTGVIMGGQFTGWYSSADGGASFTDRGGFPAQQLGDAGDPWLARDAADGVIYLSALSLYDVLDLTPSVLVFRSIDDGRTWQPPSVVGGNLKGVLDKPEIAVDSYPGRGQHVVYAAVRDFTGALDAGSVYVSRSLDAGATWGDPVDLADAGAGEVQGVAPVVLPDHSLLVTWYAKDAGKPAEIRARRSDDLGQTFGPAVTVATLAVASEDGDLGLPFRSNAFPAAAVNPATGAVYVTYNDLPGAVLLTSSADGGRTWAAPRRLDTSPGVACMPMIAVAPDGQHVGVFWYSYAGGLIDVRGEEDGGREFRVTTAGFPVIVNQEFELAPDYMGDYNSAVADLTHFYVAWGDNRGATPDVRLAAVPV